MKKIFMDRDWTHLIMTGELKKKNNIGNENEPIVDLRDVVLVDGVGLVRINHKIKNKQNNEKN